MPDVSDCSGGFFRIIEVYDIEFCLFRVFVTMLQEVIIHNGTEVCEFEIITVQSKSFLYLLFKEIVYHCIRFAGAGCTQYNCGAEWVDYVNPPLVPLLLVIKSCGQVDGIIVCLFSVSCMKDSFSLLNTSVMRLLFRSLLIQLPDISRQIKPAAVHIIYKV